ncbi:antibiotic biosynthesis monooxygenase family protein [Rhodococcus erythropolis]|nr:antibiotic biosynthesis monooxygenase family protein [Rhodococcus erythropolis]
MIVEEFDSRKTFFSQFQDSVGPITLLDMLIAPAGKREETLAAWTEHAKILRRHPGLISVQMHRGSSESETLVNIAVWESAQALLDGVQSDEFAKANELFPEGTICRRLLTERIAVEGVCLG